MRKYFRAKTKGQTLAIVGLLLATGVLVGLVAVAFDGASALLQRRVMQNGSEAGALAGINLMGQNLLVTCQPIGQPCHPTYNLRNSDVYTQVNTLAQRNRGGAIGATSSNYTVTVGYHYGTGNTVCSGPEGPTCWRPTVNDANVVPNYVDGIIVTTTIRNPTTFAKALPPAIVGTQLTGINVTSVAAAQLNPTCAPQFPQGQTVPFTRFRPVIEYDMLTSSNEATSPFNLWSPSSDLQNDSNYKNVVSLAQDSFLPSAGGNVQQQLLTDYDHRFQYVVGPLTDGLLQYNPNRNYPGGGTCATNPAACGDCQSNPGACADMAGNANLDVTDIGNWLFWQWKGTVSLTTTTWPQSSMSWYPATAATNYGRCTPIPGCGVNPPTDPVNGRPGDWAETYNIGNIGNNIGEPMRNLVANFGRPGALTGPPWNLGLALTSTVYLWGENFTNPANYDDHGRSAQWQHEVSCGISCTQQIWEDLRITGNLTNNQGLRKPNGSNEIDRVHFTRAIQMVFYENTVNQGGNSEVNGFVLSPYQPGPTPDPGGGTCNNWAVGGGSYGRQILPP